ncbi:hypothetical protein [Dichotomicrobium thermohalophilum]|uniref:Uncharacterized protein n=1 Tax=Dichotomicrobium thermohalophilum TaxID=933063 RepID=A0A397PAR3_9HYPH|nr:hypothetical protein [Dichotomicrobium thermohalophilum]RIA45473.1 hypothetical protein BXY53_2760 [Dichotomicrobium thermohalophilum]
MPEDKKSPLQSASEERGRIDQTPDLPTEKTIRDIVEAPEPAEKRQARLLDAKSKLQASMSANPSAHHNKLIEGIDDALAEIEAAGGETGTRSPTDVSGSGGG